MVKCSIIAGNMQINIFGIPLENFAEAQIAVQSDMQDLKVCGMTDASK
jgi:hypothetical protein